MFALHLLALTLLFGPSLAPASAGRSPQTSDGLITLDVKDADLEDLLLLLAEAGDVNLVVDPDAARARKVTTRLSDVPWQQAVDLVLRPFGLVAVREGHVIRVATASRLVQEEHQTRQLAEAREQAGRLVTIAVPLSYADATTAGRLVQTSLTPRGDVIVDRRTNTLIVRDVGRDVVPAGDAPPREPLPGPAVRLRVEIHALAATELPTLARASHHRALPLAAAGTEDLLSVARLVAEAELGLDVDEEVLLDLVPLAGELSGLLTTALVVSPRRDGPRLVLTVRDVVRGSDRWWADAATVQVIALPGDGAERALLVLRPL